MRTPLLTSGKAGGGLLAGAVLALSFATVTHASTSISGTPPTSVAATRYYGFQSWASDTDHLALSYSIANKPSWATFDAKYGHLYGTPSAANVGTYSNIVITASDGVSKASLPAFSIKVTGTGSSGGSGSTGGSSGAAGAATVNWHPPTENTSGATITNLAGYLVVWGTNKNAMTSFVTLANPGLTSYVVENLAAGTYYFGVTAYNNAGGSSAVSSIVSKTIK